MLTAVDLMQIMMGDRRDGKATSPMKPLAVFAINKLVSRDALVPVLGFFAMVSGGPVLCDFIF
jgi:hypothetical protein